MIGRIKAYLAIAVLAVVALGAALLKAMKMGEDKQKAKQNEAYVETSKRIADEPIPDDSAEWLRKRAERRNLR